MHNSLKSKLPLHAFDRPGYILISLILLLLLGYLIFAGLLSYIVALVYGIDLQTLSDIISNPQHHPNARQIILIMQTSAAGGIFIVCPLLLIWLSPGFTFSQFIALPTHNPYSSILTIAVTLCAMIGLSLVIEWNQNIQLPESLLSFENWARVKEDTAERLTNHITQFESIWQFLIGFIVIAILPAFGEELFFRGILQNIFGVLTANYHIAIWVTAIIFGVFHLQFFGVVPRILLGALFGYLYYWSGHLTLAMLAHLFNNGLTLLMIYLHQLKLIDFDPLKVDSSPSVFVVSAFVIAGFLFLNQFRKVFSSSYE